jgi:hypothetical protein
MCIRWMSLIAVAAMALSCATSAPTSREQPLLLAQAVCTYGDSTYSCCLKRNPNNPEICGGTLSEVKLEVKPDAPVVPVVNEATEPVAAPWSCEAQCNVQAIPNKAPASFPDRVYGAGIGSSEGEACMNAKRVATQAAPAGTYARHCKCDCAKG